MTDVERAEQAVTKANLDAKVAALLSMSIHDVSMVTSLFLRLLSIQLAKYSTVNIVNFGWFHRSGSRVFFHKSRRLKRFLKEAIDMEKLGVDEGMDQEKMEKMAAQDCPGCGAKVERHGRTLVCPNCGTAPFEKSSSDSK